VAPGHGGRGPQGLRLKGCAGCARQERFDVERLPIQAGVRRRVYTADLSAGPFDELGPLGLYDRYTEGA
jgi:hypothetical protein